MIGYLQNTVIHAGGTVKNACRYRQCRSACFAYAYIPTCVCFVRKWQIGDNDGICAGT
jgi:hypothetical protein